jgi:hypothetical protein
MPLLAPAMINVFFWVAVHAMQELSMALMLYNPNTVVISTMIWSMWQNGRTADAAVLGVVLILLSALLLLGGHAVSYLRRGLTFERTNVIRVRICKNLCRRQGGSAGAAWGVLRGRQGRAVHAAWPERLRQDDNATLHRRVGAAFGGRDRD